MPLQVLLPMELLLLPMELLLLLAVVLLQQPQGLQQHVDAKENMEHSTTQRRRRLQQQEEGQQQRSLAKRSGHVGMIC
mgnify:CR=1 FL=1